MLTLSRKVQEVEESQTLALTARGFADSLTETGLDPKWLKIEITESAFLEDLDNAVRTLENLHALVVERRDRRVLPHLDSAKLLPVVGC